MNFLSVAGFKRRRQWKGKNISIAKRRYMTETIIRLEWPENAIYNLQKYVKDTNNLEEEYLPIEALCFIDFVATCGIKWIRAAYCKFKAQTGRRRGDSATVNSAITCKLKSTYSKL